MEVVYLENNRLCGWRIEWGQKRKGMLEARF